MIGDPQFDQASQFAPATRASAMRFAELQRRSHCVFASKARVWGSPDWTETASVTVNLASVLPDFGLFVSVSKALALDCYVLEVRGDGYGESLEQLSNTTRNVLTRLSVADPLHVNCMSQEIEDPSWSFSFDGERLFVLTVAPCYPVINSRHCPFTNSVFVVFQPEHSFERVLPPGHQRIPEDVRARIREAFAKHGQPYDVQITTSPYEAHRYVKPLKLGEPVVRWWIEQVSQQTQAG